MNNAVFSFPIAENAAASMTCKTSIEKYLADEELNMPAVIIGQHGI